MTCIVGIAHKGKVYIGGDSLGSSSNFNCNVRSDTKVFKNNQFLIGYTSSFRMGQLLRCVWLPPKKSKNLDDFTFMVRIVIPSIIRLFKDNEFAEVEKEAVSGGSFLVGFNKNLYTIYDDYQVATNASNVNAVGCGGAFALGALLAQSNKLSPTDRISQALDVACELSAGVRGPYVIESI